MIKLWF